MADRGFVMAGGLSTFGGRLISIALLFGAAVFIPAPAHGANRGKHLAPQDYMAIRELIEAYPNLLDTCANDGYGYADQYAPTGTFGVSSAWGDDGHVWFRGREELAVAAGGGARGCHGRTDKYHHLSLSPVIEATPIGAHATSTLLMITDGSGDRAAKIEWQGGYEDTFVRTKNGWRFASRRHVWPGYDWPATPAEMAERLAKQRAND
jgi:hypothetical protein